MLLLTPDFGIALQIFPRFQLNVGYNLAGQTKLASTFGEEYEHRFDH